MPTALYLSWNLYWCFEQRMFILFFLSQLGRLRVPFPIPEEIEAREAKIKDYFLREIDRLITEKHICHVENLAIAANVRLLRSTIFLSRLYGK